MLPLSPVLCAPLPLSSSLCKEKLQFYRLTVTFSYMKLIDPDYGMPSIG
ncbi:hypothetical protein OSCI_3800018 [Kamptonema sp. PCC 6506]|nr:hypothetical protein OSCI_3800018 [Kamptonema sp. PCC 6506]